MWNSTIQFSDEDVVFSYKNTQIQYSSSDHVFFTAKNNKFFGKKKQKKTTSVQCVKLL